MLAYKTIEEYLEIIKRLINENDKKLIIAVNRDKNLKFMIKYSLNKSIVKEMLNKLTENDFREKVINKKEKYKDEELYIFSIKEELVDFSGNINSVEIYIKFNLKDDLVYLISFHEAEYQF